MADWYLIGKAVTFLVEAARQGELVYYGDLGRHLGVEPIALDGVVLGYIRNDVCEEHRWPPLTAIVVNRDSSMPGAGFWTAWPHLKRDDWDREWVNMVKRVFAHDWSQCLRRYGK